MDLSASTIRDRSFSQSRPGLDADEVHAFLDDVADRWAEMRRRIDALEEKLNDIGDAASTVQHTKERAETLRDEMHAKEERLDERERELDARREQLDRTAARLRSIASRLQDTLQEETRALSALTEEPAADGDEPEEETGARSTEEWIDSLLPDGLPDNLPATTSGPQDNSAADETGTDELSADEAQVESVKQNGQGRPAENGQTASASSAGEESGAPPTREMKLIWDVPSEQE